MGSSWSKRAPPVIASSECPIYGVSAIGGHHLLVGGGGGSSRSGVPNLIEAFLLEVVPGDDERSTVRAVRTTSFDTGTFATMNLDLFNLNFDSGETLVAAGQDEFCKLYQALCVARPMGSDSGKKAPSGSPLVLGYDLSEYKSFRSDWAEGPPGSSYQKVVRFSPGDGRFLVSGGADGRLRVWEPKEGKMEKVDEVLAHKGEVGDVDVSADGGMLLSLGSTDGACTLWSLDKKDGAKKRADVLFQPPDSDQKFKTRAARFTRLGSRTYVYLTVSVPVQRSSKGQRSFLNLWVYNPKLGSNRSCLTRAACADTASCVALSADTALVALGTLSGSVGVFETEDLTPLSWITETHGIFVTGLTFLPPASLGPGSVGFGLGRDWRASVVSVAADKTIQVHHVPFPAPASLSATLIRTLLALLLLTLLLRAAGL